MEKYVLLLMLSLVLTLFIATSPMEGADLSDPSIDNSILVGTNLVSYFRPTGWTYKSFINYHCIWESGATSCDWVNVGAYTLIKNYGGGTLTQTADCSAPPVPIRYLTRWDIIHTSTDPEAYWGLSNDQNVSFYFRKAWDYNVQKPVIYIPGHYTVDWDEGLPENTHPPSNVESWEQLPPPPTPVPPGHEGHMVSSEHQVKPTNPGYGICRGWTTGVCVYANRPYTMMPSSWDFDMFGPFHTSYEFNFGPLPSRDKLCTFVESPGEGVVWDVTVCLLPNYLPGEEFTCNGITYTYPVAEPWCGVTRGSMAVSILHEYSDGDPGWDITEKWFFKKDVGIVAIERESPDLVNGRELRLIACLNPDGFWTR